MTALTRIHPRFDPPSRIHRHRGGLLSGRSQDHSCSGRASRRSNEPYRDWSASRHFGPGRRLNNGRGPGRCRRVIPNMGVRRAHAASIHLAKTIRLNGRSTRPDHPPGRLRGGDGFGGLILAAAGVVAGVFGSLVGMVGGASVGVVGAITSLLVSVVRSVVTSVVRSVVVTTDVGATVRLMFTVVPPGLFRITAAVPTISPAASSRTSTHDAQNVAETRPGFVLMGRRRWNVHRGRSGRCRPCRLERRRVRRSASRAPAPRWAGARGRAGSSARSNVCHDPGGFPERPEDASAGQPRIPHRIRGIRAVRSGIPAAPSQARRHRTPGRSPRRAPVRG